MSKPDLSDYVEVKDRIKEFYEKYPDGVLQSEIYELTETRVTMRAYAHRSSEDLRPGQGTSWMNIPGSTPYTKGSEIENAETSAWGRALASLGIGINRSVASSEEVEAKKQPTTNQPTTLPTQAAVRVEPERGLTDAQKKLYSAKLGEHGITTPGQRKSFAYQTTGKLSSLQMTSEDLDKALAALTGPDAEHIIANALAVV